MSQDGHLDPKYLTKYIIIFTDGAASGNPGPGGWGAVVVFPSGEVKELGGGSAHATNNQMELMAAVKAIDFIREKTEPVLLYSDSTYVLRGISQWIHAWRRRGWKTADGKDVQNQGLWQDLDQSVSVLNGVEWKYVRGHVGVPGNERADAIATAFVKKKWVDLYEGSLLQYEIPIHDLPPDQPLPAMKDRASAKKQPAYSYLSNIDGEVMRHANWKSCEARVKGRSKARFKKAATVDAEKSILAEWKISASRVKDDSES